LPRAHTGRQSVKQFNRKVIRQLLLRLVPEASENRQVATRRELATPGVVCTSEAEQGTQQAVVLDVLRHDRLAFAGSGHSVGTRCSAHRSQTANPLHSPQHKSSLHVLLIIIIIFVYYNCSQTAQSYSTNSRHAGQHYVQKG